MNYEAIDRWNGAELQHSVLSRHKYIKKVGTGPSARYFYSEDEYRRYLRNTQSPGEHANNMKKQNIDLGTLRASAKKFSTAQTNNAKKFQQKIKTGFFTSGPWHSTSSTQRGHGTLYKSGFDRTLKENAAKSDFDRKAKRSTFVYTNFGRKGSSTLRASAKKRKKALNSEHILKTGMRVLKTSFGLHLGGALINSGRKKMKSTAKKYRRLERKK